MGAKSRNTNPRAVGSARVPHTTGIPGGASEEEDGQTSKHDDSQKQRSSAIIHNPKKDEWQENAWNVSPHISHVTFKLQETKDRE